MRTLRECSSKAVLNHWEQVDSSKSCPHATLWRKRIWAPLPTNIRWYEAEIEKKDLERVFIISSDEWSCFSRSFRLTDVAREISKHPDSNIARTIFDLIERFRKGSDNFDKKLTIVSPSLNGDFTVIDGNKRLIALHSVDALAGSTVYLGISTMITNYPWAKRVIH